ncbi:C1GALT1-specific chaperone 1-like protein [Macrosteles quadrilineatus]|uniref:C1GALT1-specific chaperone 1-like protein n=1 Tax=Macrosteles quadrilineatus TaxID=74068 RepID=UPI0023E28D28|nr:C1GALT1-specific chaperone 1-like protein [Macrosteles quadrilineatus]
MAIYPSKSSVFLLGFSIGVIFAFILTVSKDKFGRVTPNKSIYYAHTALHNPSTNHEEFYHKWLKKMRYMTYRVNFDYYSYSGNQSLATFLESQLLKHKVNIMCVMFVKNVNNAYAAMNTWMKHCNHVMFYGLKPESYIKITVMRPKSSWHYLCEVINHLDKSGNNYQWVLFVPDDIFAIPENLRYYLFGKNYEDLFYFGRPAFLWNVHYNFAGAGYVLSKGSIKALRSLFPSSESCVKSGKYWKNEDYYLDKFLLELGAPLIDTRDQLGRDRFHMFTPAQLMAPGNEQILNNYHKNSLYPVVQGQDCCSSQSVTFQGTDAAHIYFYHYLLYNLHVHFHPGHLGNNKSRRFTPSDQVWQRFVSDELGPDVNLSAISPDQYYELWSNKVDSPSSFNEKLKALFLGCIESFK